MKKDLQPLDENEKNYIVKLTEHLKSLGHSSKCIIKKVREFSKTKGIALGLTLILFLGGATACSNTPDASTDSSMESGYTNSDSSVGSEIKEDYSKYSKILQEVLTNNYYNNLLAQAKVDASLYSSAKFATHPYGFLEREGFDIEAIKDGELDCKTYAFYKESEPNNLYMAVYAEKDEGIYNEYLIRYKLTEQEMYDYKMLYTMPENSSNADTCLQVFFINDAVSRTKSAEILSECKSTVAAHEKIANDESLKKNICDYFLDGKNKQFDIIVSDVDPVTSSFNLYIFTLVNRSVAGTNSTDIAEFTFRPMIGANPQMTDSTLILPGAYNADYTIYAISKDVTNTKTFGIGWSVKDMVNFKDIATIDYQNEK